jgi:hypothetical protein
MLVVLLRIVTLVRSHPENAVDVRSQEVRVAAHLLNGTLTVGLVDPHRPAAADAVGVQENHDLADDLLFGPCRFDLLPAFAEALVDAHRRGVKVQVILDKSQRTERYSSATFLCNNGIPCLIDTQHTFAHNNVTVIDGQMVIAGSFNFTKASEKNNAENLLVIHNAELAGRSAQKWNFHREHSEPYGGLAPKKARSR